MKTLEITDANFDELVLRSDKPVVVDFWAEWCGPCRMIGKAIEDIGEEYDGKVTVGKLNVDMNPQLSVRFGVRNIPLVLYFKNGEVVDKSVGAVAKTALTERLEKHLD